MVNFTDVSFAAADLFHPNFVMRLNFCQHSLEKVCKAHDDIPQRNHEVQY